MPQLGPMSPVWHCPGQRLPLYRFAPPASSPYKRSYKRVSSRELLVMVPDADFDRSSLSRTSSSDDLVQPNSPSTDESSTGAGVVPSYCSPASPVLAQDSTPAALASGGDSGSLLDVALTALWDDCASRGLFRYDLSSIKTRQVPGRLHFIAQLNEGRANKKRPTECRLDAVVQAFDEAKFNFKKAYVQEVLFQFEPSAAEGMQAVQSNLEDSAISNASPNLVIINVSPIDYGHVLLVPKVMDCLPQLVDPDTLRLAMTFAREAANPSLRVGYNSLGAYATINHLHYQAYYLNQLFPCELVPTEPLPGIKRRRDGIRINRLTRYPVNAFVVEMDPAVGLSDEEAADLQSEMAQLVGTACLRMQAMNLPHNLLICESGRRIFVFPQCFGERQAQGLIPDEVLDTGVNPAAFEIAGHILLKRQQDYDSLDESGIAKLLAFASLPEEKFLAVGAACFASKKQV